MLLCCIALFGVVVNCDELYCMATCLSCTVQCMTLDWIGPDCVGVDCVNL